MQIIPLTKTTANLLGLYAFCKENFDRAPTKATDACNLNLNDDLKYLISLVELSGYEATAINSLRHSSDYSDLFYFSFLSDELAEPFIGPLRVYKFQKLDKSLFIVTGSLNDWIRALESNLTSKSTKEQREYFGKILLLFETTGYKLLFDIFSKTVLSDGTFILEKK